VGTDHLRCAEERRGEERKEERRGFKRSLYLNIQKKITQ